MHSRKPSNPAHRPPSLSILHSNHSRSTSAHRVLVHQVSSTPTTPTTTHEPLLSSSLSSSSCTPLYRSKPWTRTSVKRIVGLLLPRTGRKQATTLIVGAFIAATVVFVWALTPPYTINDSRTKVDAPMTRIAAAQATRTSAADAARDRSSSHNAAAETKPLPSCKRTILFKMAGLHGFGSEFNLMVRAASLAQQYDYTLVPPNTEHWNYGSFEDYFDSPQLDCKPPKDTYHRTSLTFPETVADATRIHKEIGWLRKEHVVWGRRDMEGLDRTIVAAFTDEDQVARLHENELERLDRTRRQATKSDRYVPSIVSTPDLVPRAYRSVFKKQSELARQLWQPNVEIRTMINELTTRLGLGPARHERSSRPREADDVVIGMHVRLGDKYLEQSSIGPQAYDEAAAAANEGAPTLKPGLHDDAVELYLRAAVESVDAVLAKLHPQRPRQGSTWQGQPTLIVVSDDQNAFAAFKRHSLSQRFRIQTTPPPTRLEKRTGDDATTTRVSAPPSAVPQKTEEQIKRERKWKLIKRRKLGGQDEPDGFNERSFNLMTLDERVANTKTFVRDLTLLASQSDALVLTASSNVGRLLMLLAGERFVNEGLVRSVDTRWFPTSQFY
ncbi:hypothetical protein ACM66B_003125 [Microbotryomycetes sp. NB124-2]